MKENKNFIIAIAIILAGSVISATAWLWILGYQPYEQKDRLEKIEQRLWWLENEDHFTEVELDWLWQKKMSYKDLKEFHETGEIKRLSN